MHPGSSLFHEWGRTLVSWIHCAVVARLLSSRAMADRAHYVAQVNIARLRAPIDSPLLRDFVELLDPINELADRSPGFVWRLQTEDGDATAIRPFEDDQIMINMSVWESIDALGAFVYETRHIDVLRRRKEWFERMEEAYVAVWWVLAGSIPTVWDARDRLEHVRGHGPTPYAFTLKKHFPAPSRPERPAIDDDRWPCPVG